MKEFGSDKVAAAFAAFPDEVRPALLRLRDLIFEVAAGTPEVPSVTEDLRWGSRRI